MRASAFCGLDLRQTTSAVPRWQRGNPILHNGMRHALCAAVVFTPYHCEWCDGAMPALHDTVMCVRCQNVVVISSDWTPTTFHSVVKRARAVTTPSRRVGKKPRAKRGERQAEKAAHRAAKKKLDERYQDAVAWCLNTGQGTRQAVKNPAFKDLNAFTLQSRVTKEKKLTEAREKSGYMYPRDKREILLTDEMTDFVQWLKDCNKGKRPRNRVAGNEQICHLLRFRKAAIKKGGRAVAGRALSEAAEQCLRRGGPGPEWWQKLEQDRPDLYGRQPHSISAKRQRQYHEDTVTEHFHGRYGLIAELRDAGILEEDEDDGPGVGRISGENAKRLLTRDETPQFMDHNENKGNGVAKHYGDVNDLIKVAFEENRAVRTVDMVWGMDGFQYGAHLIFPKVHH